MEPEDFTNPENWGGITEPNAVNRAGASSLFEMYDSYVQAGFTEEQAFRLILTVVSSTIQAQSGN